MLNIKHESATEIDKKCCRSFVNSTYQSVLNTLLCSCLHVLRHWIQSLPYRQLHSSQLTTSVNTMHSFTVHLCHILSHCC